MSVCHQTNWCKFLTVAEPFHSGKIAFLIFDNQKKYWQKILTIHQYMLPYPRYFKYRSSKYVPYNSQDVSLEWLPIEDQYLWITTINIVLQYLVAYWHNKFISHSILVGRWPPMQWFWDLWSFRLVACHLVESQSFPLEVSGSDTYCICPHFTGQNSVTWLL